ncbi:hypothetical protein BS78_10G130800 [Paspalum vaginatum]|nr:hypothetical protein BS78_10G130800 [Paspalum vaginatum]
MWPWPPFPPPPTASAEEAPTSAFCGAAAVATATFIRARRPRRPKKLLPPCSVARRPSRQPPSSAPKAVHYGSPVAVLAHMATVSAPPPRPTETQCEKQCGRPSGTAAVAAATFIGARSTMARPTETEHEKQRGRLGGAAATAAGAFVMADEEARGRSVHQRTLLLSLRHGEIRTSEGGEEASTAAPRPPPLASVRRPTTAHGADLRVGAGCHALRSSRAHHQRGVGRQL